MILLDTGFLIALADARDRLHPRALAWSAQILEPRVVTEYVLLETVNYFSASSDRPRAHSLVSHITSKPGYLVVESSHALFEAGLRLHQQHADKEWSLTDCISFLVMRGQGIRQALAYDHHCEQAGFEALLRRDPGP
jgi:predicted nucleic acid-binding protein